MCEHTVQPSQPSYGVPSKPSYGEPSGYGQPAKPAVCGGSCLIWGDPHIRTFDKAFHSNFAEGIYWIVKSPTVSIQGRYLATPHTNGLSAMNQITVGGNFLSNCVVSVGPLTNGQIKLNGQVILQNFPSNYDDSKCGIKLEYNSQGELVDKAQTQYEKQIHIVHMQLPSGVQIEVMRWANHINVRISMHSVDGGMLGGCGNCNGNAADDSATPLAVAPSEMLFHTQTPVKPNPGKSINDCEPSRKTQAEDLCKKQQPSATGPVLEACVFDVCFAGDDYALQDGLSYSDSSSESSSYGTPSQASSYGESRPSPSSYGEPSLPSTAAPSSYGQASSYGGVSYGAVPTTTIKVEGPVGFCLIWGDPHFRTFDDAFPTFLGAGVFWIVKSPGVSIQGRYLPTPFTHGLAAMNQIVVGGPFMGNCVVSVGTMTNGQIKFDGNIILQTFPSSYQDSKCGVKITYNNQGELVDKAQGEIEKNVHIVHLELPDNVRVEVMRWSHHINARISMPQPEGAMEGGCGNFNGDAKDDATTALPVPDSEVLFHTDTPVQPIPNKNIGDCEPAQKAHATDFCKKQQPWAKGAMLDSCIFDVCFAGENFANEDGLTDHQAACVVDVVIGNSLSSKTKCVPSPGPHVQCPTTSAHENRKDSYSDTFSIYNQGNQICATRTDHPDPWGLSLVLQCTSTSGCRDLPASPSLQDGLVQKEEEEFGEASHLGGTQAVAHHWVLLAVVASAAMAAAAMAALRRRAPLGRNSCDEGSFLRVPLDALDAEGPSEDGNDLVGMA
eukprot:TRINITY_DN2278_c0_g1_i2.p1 TRINITY_DN2278_c0_g1~~TRINITY_DN2278_c0_g1_i2.p1  ORF type:complete len:780 (-),score=102.97 TRINITY_DN2278_c0_g1_i2:98-2437(-)